jgi:predicted Zn finger-like uncharacterized protein
MQINVILPVSCQIRIKLFVDFGLSNRFINNRPTKKIKRNNMRIVCPNCTSQYEVSEEAIPEAGRDVQCAKCSEIWFQDRPMQLSTNDVPLTLEIPSETTISENDQQPNTSDEESGVFRSRRINRSAPVQRTHEPEPEPQAEAPILDRPRPAIDPEVQRILRDEAEFAANNAADSVEPPVTDDVSADISIPDEPMEVQEIVADILPGTDIEHEGIEQELAQADSATAENKPSTEYVQQAPKFAIQDNQEVAPQIDADGISRVMHELDDAEQRKSAQAKESITLASAKSLREILEAEAIDPAKVAPENPKIDTTQNQAEEAPYDDLDTPDTAEAGTTQPSQNAEAFLGDLGKRPIQIHREEIAEPNPIEESELDDKGPVFVAASRPLIRPASDLIKSASSLIKGVGPQKTDELEETSIADTTDSSAVAEVDAKNKDIKLASTSQEKSGRAAFTDIDDINASLGLDKTDDEDDEIDKIDLDEINNTERSSRFSMGFLAACGVAIVTTLMYLFAPMIAEKIPATSSFISGYEEGVDNGRMVLQDMYYQGGEPGFNTLFQNAKTKFTN